MVDWKISKRQGACSDCRRPFAERERHFSVLLLRGDQLDRDDVCVSCWRDRSTGDALFWWLTRQRSESRRNLALNLDALEALFLQLEGRTELAVRELRYVLCLILMRKRRLKIARIYRDENGEGMVVRRPRRDESLSVAAFDFSPERIDELRARLREVFEGAESGAQADGDPSRATTASSRSDASSVAG